MHSGPVSDADSGVLRGLDGKNRRGWQTAVAALAERSRRHAWLDPRPLGSATAPTKLGEQVCEYLDYRRQVLPEIERHLMTAAEAKSAYQKLRRDLGSTRGPTMNKQTGTKAVPAYLTTMVNMLVDAHAAGIRYDADPQELIKLTRNGQLARVLSRAWMVRFHQPLIQLRFGRSRSTISRQPLEAASQMACTRRSSMGWN